MAASDPIYLLIASGFICVVNLIALVGLGLNYSITKKPYLGVACVAIVIEMLRQIPDALLTQYPESNTLYLISFFLQFLSSLLFLCAILLTAKSFQRRDKFLLAVLTIAYLASAIFNYFTGLPQTTAVWYLVSSPGIFTAVAIVWNIRRLASMSSSGLYLLALSSISLVLVRAWLPSIYSLDLLYLVYYMEVLLFPIMLSALNLSEVEMAQKRVQSLLDERTQSEQDLRFILDNSLDIILTANNVGLLLTWNKRAEALFGYTEAQAVGKVHIDELFFDNYWHRNATEFNEFKSTMANIDGGTFPVVARMKTVHRDEETYSIYVIKDESSQEQKKDSLLPLLDNEQGTELA